MARWRYGWWTAWPSPPPAFQVSLPQTGKFSRHECKKTQERQLGMVSWAILANGFLRISTHKGGKGYKFDSDERQRKEDGRTDKALREPPSRTKNPLPVSSSWRNPSLNWRNSPAKYCFPHKYGIHHSNLAVARGAFKHCGKSLFLTAGIT